MRTIRTLWKRFGEHSRFVEGGDDKHSVPQHFLKYHGKSSIGLKVWDIESIPGFFPTAERFKCFYQREKFCIYTLDTLVPGGLNKEIELNIIIWSLQYCIAFLIILPKYIIFLVFSFLTLSPLHHSLPQLLWFLCFPFIFFWFRYYSSISMTLDP